MGHERVGTLPKSQRWREVVQGIADLGTSDLALARIAQRTTLNVANRLASVHRDPGAQASFQFLLGLAVASRSPHPQQLLAVLGIESLSTATPLSLAKAVQSWVAPRTGSTEYREIAQAAAIDAIADWTVDHKPIQLPLAGFTDPTLGLWRQAGTGAGFCELSRLFFAHFTGRYLNYFLDREASAVLPSLDERDRFGEGLGRHVDAVSHHAFETAKITQSFSAGWFNSHAIEGMPSVDAIEGFLAVAFRKMSAELALESEQ